MMGLNVIKLISTSPSRAYTNSWSGVMEWSGAVEWSGFFGAGFLESMQVI